MRRIKSFSTIVLVIFALIFTTKYNSDYENIAYAYEFIYSSEGNYLRWSASDVPISYTISNHWLPDAVEPVGAVYAGFKTWEDVASSSVSFNYGGTTFDTLPDEEDDVNMIGWNAQAFVGGVESGAIGATYIAWYDTETLYYDEVDIALSIYYPWSTTGGANKFDIQGVVTHEVGHLLGLGHTDWEVDYGYYTPAEFTALYPERCECTMTSGPTFLYSHTYEQSSLLRTLEQDDIAGITVLYPLGYASGGGGIDSGGCFIATAAYETSLAEEVKTLSRFRDEFLLKNALGRIFVKSYYKVSPDIAEFIRKRPLVRKIIRLQLKPVTFIVNLFVSDDKIQ